MRTEPKLVRLLITITLFAAIVATNVAWYWYAQTQNRAIEANWSYAQTKTQMLHICLEHDINPCTEEAADKLKQK